MSRWVGIILVVVLLAAGWVAYTTPDGFLGLPGQDATRLIYLMMTLLLVSGAGFGFWRIRAEPGRAIGSLVFWAMLLVAIVLAYQAFR